MREWHKSRTAARHGNLLRVNECFAAYVEWCKARGLEACSLTKFGTTMKAELGVSYVERSKRGGVVRYRGIALASISRLS